MLDWWMAQHAQTILMAADGPTMGLRESYVPKIKAVLEAFGKPRDAVRLLSVL